MSDAQSVRRWSIEKQPDFYWDIQRAIESRVAAALKAKAVRRFRNDQGRLSTTMVLMGEQEQAEVTITEPAQSGKSMELSLAFTHPTWKYVKIDVSPGSKIDITYAGQMAYFPEIDKLPGHLYDLQLAPLPRVPYGLNREGYITAIVMLDRFQQSALLTPAIYVLANTVLPPSLRIGNNSGMSRDTVSWLRNVWVMIRSSHLVPLAKKFQELPKAGWRICDGPRRNWLLFEADYEPPRLAPGAPYNLQHPSEDFPGQRNFGPTAKTMLPIQDWLQR